jgi:cytochrome c-type biogenesis protein CcmF
LGNLGSTALFYLLFLIPYIIIANIIGIRFKSERLKASAKWGIMAFVLTALTAAIALIYLLVNDRFDYAYVAQYSSTDTPLVYKITAFWGGNAGSMLLWLTILSIYTGIIAFQVHQNSQKILPYVTTILAGIAYFFVLVLNFVDNPFDLSKTFVEEGSGLNPLLQNSGMAVHPVNLYLGYIGFAVPFAYAITALITRQTDGLWLKVTRRWTMISWLFLSIGIIYGSQWAYVALGWGGYWAWDPVENASLMPWLTATAFLHSSMVQEKKGMLKGWNMILISLTFLLTIFGTFLTRSGLLWSVHAFANGPLGAYFLTFVGLILIVALALIIWRWPDLKADAQVEAVVSKENSFLLNNLLLIGSALTVFWGTVYPVVSESITGEKMTVGAQFFNGVDIPILIALIILMGICPLIAWRRSSFRMIRRHLQIPIAGAIGFVILTYAFGVRDWFPLFSIASAAFVGVATIMEYVKAVAARQKLTGESIPVSLIRLFQKNRRRYGGYMVHLAVVVMAIGLTAAGVYDVDVQKTLKPGEGLQVGDYHLTYRNLGEEIEPGRTMIYADLEVRQNGRLIGVVRPEKVFYDNGAQPATEVALRSTALEDLYVILGGWDEKTNLAVFQIKIFPLINWVWYGGYLLIIGTLLSLWPESPSAVQPLARRKPSPVRGGVLNEV